MKNKIKQVIAGVICLFTISSCSDFLERYPLDEMSDKDYFTVDTDLKYYMNGMYENLIRKMNARWNDLNQEGTDKIKTGNDDWVSNTPSAALMRHSVSGNANEVSTFWNDSYNYIRKANYFLEKAYNVQPMTTIGRHYLGEGYYCRASKYFDLLKNFGGVPFIDKSLNIDSKDLYKPRNSRKEVAERIIADLDSAILHLNWKGEGEAVAGRINKESALLMKTRVALFEGSWEYYHGRKGTQFQVAGSDGSDFLRQAADAGETLIAKHGGNLYKGTPGNEYFEYFNQMDYAKIQGAFLYKAYSRSLGHIQKWYRTYSEGFYGCLTKSAIDSYLMKDGKPALISSISLPDETMNELAQNKDPRLAQTIWYPKKGIFFNYWPLADHGYKTSYPGLIQKQQRNPAYSGYRLWKGVSFDNGEYDNGEMDDLILRYEEALLNFAEAKAILGTLTQGDLDKSVNYIRTRIGMPGMNMGEINGWSISYTKREGYDPSMLNIVNEIRRERRVEFMVEGLRADDIKRWALYDDVFNGWKPVGAYAQEYLDYWNNPERVLADGFDWAPVAEVTLQKGKDFDTIGKYINPFFKNADFKESGGRGYYIAPDRDYLMAIPREEITLYKNKANIILEQNPGWF